MKMKRILKVAHIPAKTLKFDYFLSIFNVFVRVIGNE